MALSASTLGAQRCTAAFEHNQIASSLTNLVSELGYQNVDALITKLVTTDAFLGPWADYRDDCVLNPKVASGDFLKEAENLSALYKDVKRAVTCRSRKSTDEDSDPHALVVHLFASLFSSLMAPGSPYDHGSMNDEEWLHDMYTGLLILVGHLGMEYHHGHGVLMDAIEELSPSNWLSIPDEEKEVEDEVEDEDEQDEENFDASDDELSEESNDDFTPSKSRPKTNPSSFDEKHPISKRRSRPTYSTADLVTSARKKLAGTKDASSEDEEIDVTDTNVRETWVIPDSSETDTDTYESHPDYAAMKKMFGNDSDILPKLPAAYKKPQASAKKAPVNKVADPVVATPAELAIIAQAKVSTAKVKKPTIDLANSRKEQEEETEGERLLFNKMFNRPSDSPLPIRDVTVIEDNEDSDTTSGSSSPSSSQRASNLSSSRLSSLLSSLSISRTVPQTPRRNPANLPLLRQLSAPRPAPETGVFDPKAPFSPLPSDDPFTSGPPIPLMKNGKFPLPVCSPTKKQKRGSREGGEEPE